MKTYFISILLIFMLVSCEDKEVIEVIPNYDEIYLPLNKVDSTPQLIEGDEKKLVDKINEEVKNSGLEDPKLDYKLLIDENGSVRMVEVIKSPEVKYTDLAVKEFESWKFTPGQKDGKPVKSQYRWYFNQKKEGEELTEINQDDFIISAEIMPEPIGGIQAIQEKIVYPEIAKRAGIEGKVYVHAFIDENGSVTGTKIIKGIGAGCDEQALYAVKNTKFTPGKEKGKNVKVQVTVPIAFKLY